MITLRPEDVVFDVLKTRFDGTIPQIRDAAQAVVRGLERSGYHVKGQYFDRQGTSHD